MDLPAAVVSDGMPEPVYTRDKELYYQATTWPGARVPHVWLESKSGVRISSLDLTGQGKFALLTGIGGEAWVEAARTVAAETGTDIQCSMIGPGRDATGVFGAWAEACETGESGCLLVRPDQHVAFRAQTVSSGAADQLRAAMQQILGKPGRGPPQSFSAQPGGTV